MVQLKFFEVDPMKAVGQDLQQNGKNLLDLSQKIVDAIFSSVDKVPM